MRRDGTTQQARLRRKPGTRGYEGARSGCSVVGSCGVELMAAPPEQASGVKRRDAVYAGRDRVIVRGSQVGLECRIVERCREAQAVEPGASCCLAGVQGTRVVRSASRRHRARGWRECSHGLQPLPHEAQSHRACLRPPSPAGLGSRNVAIGAGRPGGRSSRGARSRARGNHATSPTGMFGTLLPQLLVDAGPYGRPFRR